MIDGKYNEFIESDSISVCDVPKSDNPLIAFIYKEMVKTGNLTTACPVRKGVYTMHSFGLNDKDMVSS